MESYRLRQLSRRLLLLRKSVLQRLNVDKNKLRQHVVFVAGVQRSGTNMLMDILERSVETDVYHERDARAFKDYQMRDIPVIERLIDDSRAPCFVIKALCELQDLHRLMDVFTPDISKPAKTLWVNRHYNDVVNSMLVSFRNQAEQVSRIARYRDSDGWLSEGISDETYHLIRELAHPELSNASAAALIWYFRSIQFYEQKLDNDPRVMLIQYENLVSDPCSEFRRISRFLGFNYTGDLTRKVHSASVRRRPPSVIDAPIMKLCDELTARFQMTAKKQALQFIEKEI